MRAGLVHRIDKNTSGLLVVAKNEQSHARLAKQFFDHTIGRRYVALVWGNFEEDEGTITGNIGRSPRDRQKMFVFEDGSDGKHAVTHWRVVAGASALQRRTLRRRPHPQGNDLLEIQAVHRKLLRSNAPPCPACAVAGLRTPHDARGCLFRERTARRFPRAARKMGHLRRGVEGEQ